MAEPEQIWFDIYRIPDDGIFDADLRIGFQPSLTTGMALLLLLRMTRRVRHVRSLSFRGHP